MNADWLFDDIKELLVIFAFDNWVKSCLQNKKSLYLLKIHTEIVTGDLTYLGFASK